MRCSRAYWMGVWPWPSGMLVVALRRSSVSTQLRRPRRTAYTSGLVKSSSGREGRSGTPKNHTCTNAICSNTNGTHILHAYTNIEAHFFPE